MRLGLLFAAAFLASATTLAQAEDQAQDTSPSVAAAQAKMAAVQRHVDAYRSGSLDRFVASFAPDAEVHSQGVVAKGHAQIRALYSANFGPGAPSVRIYNSGMSGDRVFLSVGYVFPNGEEMCCSYTEYEVRGGKISLLVTAS